MFEQGDKAVIDLDWFCQVQSTRLDLSVFTPQVEVIRAVEEPAPGTPQADLPTGVRWIEVRPEGMDYTLTVPEHLLHRALVERPPQKPSVFSGNELPFALRRSLREAALGMELEWRGHYQKGQVWNQGWLAQTQEDIKRLRLIGHNLGSDYGNHTCLTPEQADQILKAAKSGVALDQWIPFFTAERQMGCPYCEGGNLFETNGLVMRPMDDCVSSEGLVTTWEMDFPSGKILVDDDLRDLCRIAGYERDVNTIWGTHLQILDYAAQGMALGFGIGNTSPTLYRTGEGKYEIGSKRTRVWKVAKVEGQDPPEGLVPDDPDLDTEFWWTTIQPEDRTDEYDKYGDDVIDDNDGSAALCSICTDLWAYSIIDLEEAKRRADYYGIDLDERAENWSVNIVDIEPGRYRFQHFHNIDRDDPQVTFARFERIGASEGCEDWVSKDRSFTVDMSQAVQISAERWERLFGGSRTWEQRCASVISSELRGGIPERDWHRNGHRNSYLPTDIEGVPIRPLPRFRFQYNWQIRRTFIETSVNRNDAMFGGDVLFNNSYAIAAGHVLESAISFGLPTHRNTQKKSKDYNKFNCDEVRGHMHKAVDLWYGLIERYPHVAEAMPEFTKWMAHPDAVRLWVDHFDLGPEVFDEAAEQRRLKAAEEVRLRAAEENRMREPGTQVRVKSRIIGPSLYPVIGTIGKVVRVGSPDHLLVVEFSGRPYLKSTHPEKGIVWVTYGVDGDPPRVSYTGCHKSPLRVSLPIGHLELGPQALKKWFQEKALALSQVLEEMRIMRP